MSLRNWAPIISGASKATKAAFWSGLKSSCPKSFFPPEYDTGWLKEHGRLVRWRLQRVSLSPEEAGLCGCWQFIAVWRERQELRQGKVTEQSEEYSFYCTSAAPKQYSARQLLQAIRDHWSSQRKRLPLSPGCQPGRRRFAHRRPQRRLRHGHLAQSALGPHGTAKAPRQNPGAHLSGMAAQADHDPKNPTHHPNPMNSG